MLFYSMHCLQVTHSEWMTGTTWKKKLARSLLKQIESTPYSVWNILSLCGEGEVSSSSDDFICDMVEIAIDYH